MLSWIFISYVYLLLYCAFLLYVLCIFLITLLYCIAYFYNNIKILLIIIIRLLLYKKCIILILLSCGPILDNKCAYSTYTHYIDSCPTYMYIHREVIVGYTVRKDL